MRRLYSFNFCWSHIFLLLFFITAGYSYVSAATIYSENMYNGSGGASGDAISTHESNNRFNEDGLTYSGTGDMRTTSPGSGYSGASGTWNVMLNATGETLIMDGLNMSSYSSVLLSFGIRKATTTENGSGMIVEYSTSGSGGSYTALSWGTLPTGSGTATWYLRSGISIPTNATTIRFRTTNAVEFRIDDILLDGTSASSYSGVSPGSGTEPSTLSSLVTALSGASSPQQNAVLNFDFKVTDDANTTSGNDALPTLITQIVIPQGTGNDIADWTLAIAGAELSDGTNTKTGTINAANITFSSITTTSGALGEVTDGSDKTYMLKIWLKTALGGTLPTTIDGLNLAFKIDRTNFTTASSTTSTQFESGAGTVVESGSTNNAVDVTATKLVFVQGPSDVDQDAVMSPSVTVSATDPNGNRDKDYSSSVTMGQSGSAFSGSAITSVNASNGLATFTNLKFSTPSNSVTIAASDGAITATGNSTAFKVNALAPEINVKGNNVSIVDGDNTPVVTDSTNFGSVAWGGSITRTFTIQNTGSGSLTINSPYIDFAGAEAAEFSVTANPSYSISAGSSTTFKVTFTPAGLGDRNATIRIYNSDADEGTYDFAIRGTCTPSNLSDIIANTSYTYNSNIEYIKYQNPDIVNSTTNDVDPTKNSIDLFKFDIRDGGGAVDADNLPTILSSITFNVTNLSMIRDAALFNGNSLVSGSPSFNTGAGTLAFSGLSGANVTANDTFTNSLILRVSFNSNSSITDNAQIQVTISNANVTAATSNTSSLFTAFSSVVSSTTSDRNRIEVVATKLTFSTIADGYVSTNLTSFTVSAVDTNGRTDLDRNNETITIGTSGTGMTSSPPYTLSSGVVTITNISFGSQQSGINLNGSVAANSPLPALSGTSNPFNISPVNFVTGDYRTNPALQQYDYIGFGSTSKTTSGVWPWQRWDGSTWQDVTGASSTYAPEFVNPVPGTIYVIRGDNWNGGLTAAGGRLYNNIVIDLPNATDVFYSGNTTQGIGIATGKTLEIKKGIFDLPGRIDLQGTASLIIRKGAQMDISCSSFNFDRSSTSNFIVEDSAFVNINSFQSSSQIWSGNESFDDSSYFKITSWDVTTDPPIFTLGDITPYNNGSYSAYFGYLTIELGSISSGWNGAFPSGTFNLTHGDFTVINNDANDNINLFDGSNGDVTIGRNMITNGTEDVQFQSSAGSSVLRIKGSFLKYGTGNFNFMAHGVSSTTTGNLYIDGDLNVYAGSFFTSSSSSVLLTTTVYLKGSLYKAAAAYLQNSNTNGFSKESFNFSGNGTTQYVDVIPNSNDMLRFRFLINSGAYVKIKNQDWALAQYDTLIIQNGGTLDFGFASDSITALNVTMVSGTSSNQPAFILKEGGTLKITSPDGIISNTATYGVSVGNVRDIPTTSNRRTYDQLATYWYIGRENQKTGDGINQTGAFVNGFGKQVICDLATNSLTLTPTISFVLSSGTGISPTGGKLDIRKGQFIETESAYIIGASGTLYMSPGTLYKVVKGEANIKEETGDAGGTYIPRMQGTDFPYVLTGGTIELGGSTTGNYFQTLRGTSGGRPKYINVKFSGTNNYNNVTKTATDYKNLSSQTYIDSALIITGDAIVDCIAGISTTSSSFVGTGGLVMDGGRLRIKKVYNISDGPSPELDGIKRTYSCTGGTIEFYGTSASQQQKIRGYDSYPFKRTIKYNNIDINAVAANCSPPNNILPFSTYDVGNVQPAYDTLALNGTLTINAPAFFRMDVSEVVSGSGNISVQDGAGLLYGSNNGIKTSGNSSADGNIIVSGTRSLSKKAYYGFVGPRNMVTGNALPDTVAGLFIFKTTLDSVVTLSGPCVATDSLILNSGKIKSATASMLTLGDGATIRNIRFPNAGGLTNMGHEGSYVIGPMGRISTSTTDKIFPIGSNTVYGPMALEAQKANPQTYTCQYYSNRYSNRTIDQTDAPPMDHVSAVEYWTIASTAADADDNAKVTFFWRDYSQVSATSADWASLCTAHFDGTDWNREGNSPTVMGSDTLWGLVKSNIYWPSFSPGTLGTNSPNNPLPIELIRFTARAVNNISVITEWLTATELNNDYFTVERSKDGIHFEPIGTLPGAGNSSEVLFYNYPDKNPYTGNSYYRLKQTDYNGDYSYSNIVQVFISPSGSILVYPNPASDEVYMDLPQMNQSYSISFLDMLGRTLLTKEISGVSQYALPIRDIAVGTYVIEIRTGEDRAVFRIVKDR